MTEAAVELTDNAASSKLSTMSSGFLNDLIEDMTMAAVELTNNAANSKPSFPPCPLAGFLQRTPWRRRESTVSQEL